MIYTFADTHRVTCLANSRHGLVCSRDCWSRDLLTGLPVLQTHRPGLACSRDYWSCSPQQLTELPVLQTHGLVLPAQGVTGLAACSQVTHLANSQAQSCLLKGLLILQPSAAHRVTYLANSRLAVCSANSFAKSSVSDRPCFRFRNRSRCSCERFWSSSPQGVIRRFSPLGMFGGWPFVGDRLSVPLGLIVVSSRRCRELSACLVMN